MEQTAEFLGTSGQTTEADAADRGRVVGQDRHRELHTGAVPPFVAQLGCPPAQQTGNDTFDHRTAVACRAGQLHLAGGAFAVQARGGEQLLDRLRRRRGREQQFPVIKLERLRAYRQEPVESTGRRLPRTEVAQEPEHLCD